MALSGRDQVGNRRDTATIRKANAIGTALAVGVGLGRNHRQ